MDKKVFYISLSTVTFYITIGASNIALQTLFKDTVSDSLIALFMVANWLPLLIASPLWGRIADKYDREKLLLMTTIVISGLIFFLHSVFTQYIQAIILRAMFGLFTAAFLPTATAMLLRGAASEKTGKKASIFNLSRSLGFLLSGYIVSAILYVLDVLSIFWIGALVLLISAISLIPISSERKNIHYDMSNNDSLKRSLLPGRGFITRNNGHFLVIALALRHANIMSINSIIFVYMMRCGIPDYLTGAISSFNTLTQIVLMYPLGRLADKIGRKPLFMTGLLLSTIFPLIFLIANNAIMFSIGFIVIGLSFSTLISGATPFFKDIAPEGREAESLSFLNISRGVGAIIGPLITSVVIATYGYEILFLIISGLTVLATILAALVKETLRN
ncbi:MAG: MFS transporter [Candidatus Njordarchaeales archaeon]